MAVLQLESPLVPRAITVRSTLPEDQLHLRGLTLINSDTGNSRTLPSIPPTASFTLAMSRYTRTTRHSASCLHRPDASVVDNDVQALGTLQDPAFDPKRSVVLSGGTLTGRRARAVRCDHQELRTASDRTAVQSGCPGYLILTDSYYPGWSAEVDGEPATIHHADLYFRAIALEPGEHRLTLQYEPDPPT